MLEMKTIFGVLSLLVVLASVGVVAVSDLHRIEIAAGGSSAVISATTPATPPQQIQQNFEHSVEGAIQQAHPGAEDN